MGCVMSVKKKKDFSQETYKKDSQKYLTIQYESNNGITRPLLSDKQKQIVIDTWSIVSQDIARVGVITFMR